MNALTLSYRAMHQDRAYRIPMMFTTMNNVIAALSTHNWNTITGGVEHRGLHQTDKRLTKYVDWDFVHGLPDCSIFQILNSDKAIEKAVDGRSPKCKYKLTKNAYKQSLIIRNLRMQIQNSALRFDFAKRMCEKLRTVSNKWVKLAMNPQNVQAAATQILFN